MANFITFSRLLLLFGIFVLLDRWGLKGHYWGFFLTIFLIALDGIDGVVARWLRETSEFGAVFDIAIDRIVENCFWIYFAARGIIPLWIPFVIVSRGFITDGIRTVAIKQGMTAFGQKSMQKSALGKALVSSRWSRGLYGFAKVIAFLSLITIQAINLPGADVLISPATHQTLRTGGYAIVYFAVFFCIVRAIPVLVDSRALFAPRRQ